jgi:hypothetical protein
MARLRRGRMTVNYALSNNIPVFKLFYGFLKKYGLFHRLYTKRGNIVPTYKNPLGTLSCELGDLWLQWGDYILYKSAEEVIISSRTSRKLQLSQLWRFYLLDNLERIGFTSEDIKEHFTYDICDVIKANGHRGSEEIKEYFEKYKKLLEK